MKMVNWSRTPQGVTFWRHQYGEMLTPVGKQSAKELLHAYKAWEAEP